jgi:CNT family concentrative nucleoside transporter
MERLISFVGLFVMIGLAWLMSNNRRKFPWRVVIGGLILQLVFAGIMFSSRDAESAALPMTAAGGNTEAPLVDGAKAVADAGPAEKAATDAPRPRRGLLRWVDDVFNALINCVDAGSRFMFGDRLVLTESVFAFRILPSIIFFAALMQVLYYAGVMQQVVRGMGYIVQRTLGTTGPESLAAAANIFLGQTEAPLVVRPYVHSMSKSELMAVMVPGFGSTAGGVLIAYKAFGLNGGHLLTASLLSAPASLLIAKIMIPETEPRAAAERVKLDMGERGANLLEAITIGTLDGLKLALNVGAMLIAFLALIAMCDGLLGWTGSWFDQEWSLTAMLSVAFAPFAWIMGIPWDDCMLSGQLLGEKMVANEFVAYLHLGEWIKPDSAVQLSDRTVTILTYALCGFANFSSIGIQIGGIGGMAPTRQRDLAQLGLRAMLGGALANFMTACVAGMLL